MLFRSGGAGRGGPAAARAHPSTLLPSSEGGLCERKACELAKGSSKRSVSCYALWREEERKEPPGRCLIPAYLDPAALFCAETSPSPRGLNEQHPCYWPGFRGPTGWGLPCESAPCRVASKWWPTFQLDPPHPCPTSPLPTRCPPCPHSARPGDGPCPRWLESICSLS